VSVGHVSRLLEAAGIPTVVVASKVYAPRIVPMNVSRLVLTPQPLGRPLGAPGDTERQRMVLNEAKTLLETATEGGSVLTLDW